MIGKSADPPPWISDQLTAQAGVGWQSAHAWGFDLGPAAIDARLEQAQMRIEPLELAVSGGTLHLEPRVQLHGPWLLTLPAGRCAQTIAISRPMCQSWMKYVAPLLAEATAAEGRFSVDLQRFQLPLFQPNDIQAEGTLVIHSGQVGPGPVTQQVLQFVQQLQTLIKPQAKVASLLDAQRSWITLPEQQVPFRAAGGRVAHQNLTMVVGDVTVRTEGWVGLDQQMSLVAEIRIPEDWVADKRWLQGLTRQPLRVPISGTIERPQLDPRILQHLAEQSVRGAAQDLLQDQLQQQLQRVLPASPASNAPATAPKNLEEGLRNELYQQLERVLPGFK
jgi:hypothetical protein